MSLGLSTLFASLILDDRPGGVKAMKILNELTDSQLIERSSDHTYKMHRLVRLYARDRFLGDPDSDGSEAIVHHVRMAYRATEIARHFITFDSTHVKRVLDEELGWIDVDYEALLPIVMADGATTSLEAPGYIEAFLRTGNEENAHLFAKTVLPVLTHFGYWAEGLAVAEVALANVEQGGVASSGLSRRYLHDAGVCLRHLGRLDESRIRLEAARTIALDEGQERAAASCENNLGLTHAARGEPDAAATYYRWSIDRFHLIGDPDAEAGVRLNLAGVLREQGDKEQADEQLDIAAGLALESTNATVRAAAQSSLATEKARKGDHAGGLKLASVALKIFEDRREGEHVAVVKRNMAIMYADSGDYKASISSMRGALEELRRSGSGEPLLTTLTEFSFILMSAGEWGEALSTSFEARELASRWKPSAEVDALLDLIPAEIMGRLSGAPGWALRRRWQKRGVDYPFARETTPLMKILSSLARGHGRQ